jgi:hypothetical protein
MHNDTITTDGQTSGSVVDISSGRRKDVVVQRTRAILDATRMHQRKAGCDAYFKASGMWQTLPSMACSPTCFCAQNAIRDVLTPPSPPPAAANEVLAETTETPVQTARQKPVPVLPWIRT